MPDSVTPDIPDLMERATALSELFEDFWSCFNCGYLGNQCGHDETDKEVDDEACPM